MNIVAFIIGFLFGGIAVFVLRPKKDDNTKLAQYNALLNQQKQDIENLRRDNLALVREAAENKKEAETLAGVREKMLNDFKAVSAELIEKQKESVVGTQKTVLGPMQDEMKALKDGFEKKISEILKTSTENKTSIDEQIKNMIAKSDSLQHEATNLANALKNKKTQGCWGETYLENILQMLGFVEGVDYVREEFSHVDDGKNIRPDFIVNLPNNKRIIIDSKVSMESYLNYENAEDDASRERYANEFIVATQNHIDELSSKEYQKKVKDSGLDYVFMFMPLESAYILAMRKKPELYASAQKQNVALITSSLLFPMLKTVEMLLKLDRQSKNVAEVMDMVNKLYEKYCGFIDSFNSVGNSIESARKSYDTALKQLSEGKGNMSTWFDKIKDKSGITTNKKIAIEYKDE
jgi:DNA recombination protein RmuC